MTEPAGCGEGAQQSGLMEYHGMEMGTKASNLIYAKY